MIWFLLAGGILILSVALPVLYGTLAGLITRLTPGLKWKLKVSKFLVAKPFKLLGRETYLDVKREIDWLVRSQYGDDLQRYGYTQLLKKAEERDKWERQMESHGQDL